LAGTWRPTEQTARPERNDQGGEKIPAVSISSVDVPANKEKKRKAPTKNPRLPCKLINGRPQGGGGGGKKRGKKRKGRRRPPDLLTTMCKSVRTRACDCTKESPS